MKLLTGLFIVLLASFGRSEDDAMDKLSVFDNIEVVLGLIERHFGEEITKKLSFALFEGYQNSRSPVEILTGFMLDLTPTEKNSVSKGVIASIIELGEIVKQPGIQEQLMNFIDAAPQLFATISKITGGGENENPNGWVVEEKGDDSDPFETIKNKKRKSILDFGFSENEENAGEEIMELAGGLLKAGASLLQTASSEGNDGGGFVDFATKMVERMIDEGVLNLLDNLDVGQDVNDNEEDLIADDQTEVNNENVVSPTQNNKIQSSSTTDSENIENIHIEL